MTEWQPIDTYEQKDWDGDVVHLLGENGEESLGCWGWDEEHYNGYSCAWHKDDTLDPLGFEPTHWKPQE